MPRILGQERAIELLEAALRSGRFHHAWIFSGPRGVGKFTTAMEVARVLLDPLTPGSARGSGDAVGIGARRNSDIQRRIDSGTHPDLHIIRKEMALYSDNPELRDRKLLNIPIDLLRERIIGGVSGGKNYEAVAYRTPALGAGKVFIIDEAELMGSDARDPSQNAMLKTLEEPPPNTWFFLITSLPDRLRPTIHSRCQHVRFGRLDEREMAAWWKAEQARERPVIEEGSSKKKKAEAFDPKAVSASAATWALEYADGSPGVALLAMEYGFHQWSTTLDPMLRDLDRGTFPVAMGDALGAMVEEFAQAWVARHGKDSTSKDAANKDGARHVLSLLASHARRRLAEAAGKPLQADAVERWALSIDLLRECEQQIGSNVNQKLAMENLVAQWTAALSGALVA